jgi:quercetin dioxygenase-like cupin family protein
VRATLHGDSPDEEAPMADDLSVVRPRGEGRTLGAGSNVITYKLAGAETRGAFSVLEWVVPPHFQSPPQSHTNTREDWAAYVLDGTLVFQLGDRPTTVEAVRVTQSGGTVSMGLRRRTEW